MGLGPSVEQRDIDRDREQQRRNADQSRDQQQLEEQRQHEHRLAVRNAHLQHQQELQRQRQFEREMQIAKHAEQRRDQQQLEEQREHQNRLAVRNAHLQQQQEMQRQRQLEREMQIAQQEELVFKEAVERAAHLTMEENKDAVGIESCFKRQLKKFAKDATVVRTGHAQFQISSPGQNDVFFSLRMDAAPAVLQQVRSLAPAVRSTLLGNSADWLKRLGRGGESIDDFLAAVNAAQESHADDRESQSVEKKGDKLCDNCGKPLRMDCLAGGGHHCRVVATFRCPQCWKSWTTQCGRYSIKEQRVLGHKCASCNAQGEVQGMKMLTEDAIEELGRKREAAKQAREKRQAAASAREAQGRNAKAWRQHSNSGWGQDDWWQSGGWEDKGQAEQDDAWAQGNDDEQHDGFEHEVGAVNVSPQRQPAVLYGEVAERQAQSTVPSIPSEEHRSDLCEACQRYGDCRGLFIEPFQLLAIAKLLSADVDSDDSLRWECGEGVLSLAGFQGGEIRLLPHIYEEDAHSHSSEAARSVHTHHNAQIQRGSRPHAPISSHDSSAQSRSSQAGRSGHSQPNARSHRSSRSHMAISSLGSSSGSSRTLRSSEDNAFRQHFQQSADVAWRPTLSASRN